MKSDPARLQCQWSVTAEARLMMQDTVMCFKSTEMMCSWKCGTVWKRQDRSFSAFVESKVLWQTQEGLNCSFLSQKIPLVNSWRRGQSQQRFPAARRWGRRVFVGGWGLAWGAWTPRQSYWRPSVLWWPAGREVSSFWPGEHPSPLPVDRQWVVEQQQSHKKRWSDLTKKTVIKSKIQHAVSDVDVLPVTLGSYSEAFFVRVVENLFKSQRQLINHILW